MKRRLNLACALVHDPRVILLDEPTVGVDPQSLRKEDEKKWPRLAELIGIPLPESSKNRDAMRGRFIDFLHERMKSLAGGNSRIFDTSIAFAPSS